MSPSFSACRTENPASVYTIVSIDEIASEKTGLESKSWPISFHCAPWPENTQTEPGLPPPERTLLEVVLELLVSEAKISSAPAASW